MPSSDNIRGSDSGSFTTLHISLRPSRLLRIYLLAAHGVAFAALWFSALPFWASGALSLFLLFSVQRSLKRQWWDGGRELLYRNGDWVLVNNGRRQELELVGESFIHPWLTILRFKTMVLPLLPDSASPEQLQQLRRTLRFGLQSSSSDFNQR